MLGLLEALDGLGVAVLGSAELAERPVGEPEQGRGRTSAEVIVVEREVARPDRRGRWLPPCRRRARPARRGTWPPGPAGGRTRPRRRRPSRSTRPSVVRATARLVEQRLDAVEPAAGHAGADQPEGQHGPVGEELPRERVEPAAQRRLLPGLTHRRHGQLDQLSSAGEVLGGQGMADRLGPLAVVLVPVAGPAVQLGDELGFLVERGGRRGRRRTGGGSGTTLRGRRAGPRTGSPARAPRGSPSRRSVP